MVSRSGELAAERGAHDRAQLGIGQRQHVGASLRTHPAPGRRLGEELAPQQITFEARAESLAD